MTVYLTLLRHHSGKLWLHAKSRTASNCAWCGEEAGGVNGSTTKATSLDKERRGYVYVESSHQPDAEGSVEMLKKRLDEIRRRGQTTMSWRSAFNAVYGSPPPDQPPPATPALEPSFRVPMLSFEASQSAEVNADWDF